MFPEGSIDVISGTQETIFGFASKHACRCLFVPDCSLNFHKQVDPTVFQNMVTGDSVSVSVKHGLPQLVINWITSFFMAGNLVPQYTDVSGSISRRFFRFLFRTTIENRSGDLYHRIIADELPAILVRCVKTYREIALEYGFPRFLETRGWR